ncbi:MAG: pantoate--beta-alanine ligase [Solirubrobacteraceae bacterium]
MITIRTVDELRPLIAEHRRAGRVIGLVPTMGAFHDGHLSLMRQARDQCDVVVVWLFVNPAQFNDRGDLAVYPRDEARDAALAQEIGVDYLFAPPTEEVYPPDFSTTVAVGGLTEPLEGEHRGRSHFDGVTTVVTKMFNMVAPDVAYFGQKDAQQAVVVQRLVRDLNMPIRIEVCDTVREPDGLAMSSRNVHLSPEERRSALALHRALDAIDAGVARGLREAAALLSEARAELEAAQIEPDYLALVSADTLTPVAQVEGDVLALVAARLGETRLIDNHRLITAGAAASAMNNGRP